MPYRSYSWPKAFLGCATYTGKLQGYDQSNFRKRRIVLLRREKPVQALTLLAADKYASFAKDGISDSIFNHRLDSAFFKTLAQDIGEAKIAIYTVLEASGALVPHKFFNGYDTIQVHLRKQGLDTNDLYVVLAPILFMPGTNVTPGVMGGPATSAQELSARMDWVLFDPRLGIGTPVRKDRGSFFASPGSEDCGIPRECGLRPIPLGRRAHRSLVRTRASATILHRFVYRFSVPTGPRAWRSKPCRSVRDSPQFPRTGRCLLIRHDIASSSSTGTRGMVDGMETHREQRGARLGHLSAYVLAMQSQRTIAVKRNPG